MIDLNLNFVRTPTVGKKYICPDCHSEVLYATKDETPQCSECKRYISVFQLHLEIVEGE